MSTSIHRTERTLLEEFLAHPRTMTMFQSSLPHIHTAVLVKRGKVIAHATNRAGSRSMGSGYSDYTIHAERNVVKSLGDISQLRGADMYVMRISRDHKKQGFEKFMDSRPCADCQKFLEKCMREYGLKNVYFTG